MYILYMCMYVHYSSTLHVRRYIFIPKILKKITLKTQNYQFIFIFCVECLCEGHVCVNVKFFYGI